MSQTFKPLSDNRQVETHRSLLGLAAQRGSAVRVDSRIHSVNKHVLIERVCGTCISPADIEVVPPIDPIGQILPRQAPPGIIRK